MKTLDERIKKELTPIDQEEYFDDILDDVYGEIDVGVKFYPSRVLKELDPIAYRCGLNNYMDSVRENFYELDEEYYSQDEVTEIKQDMEDK